MYLHKLAAWRDATILKALEDDNEILVFRVIVTYSEELGGFVVYGGVKDQVGFFVSSQRQEKRVFKSLDTLRKTLHKYDMKSFEVHL